MKELCTITEAMGDFSRKGRAASTRLTKPITSTLKLSCQCSVVPSMCIGDAGNGGEINSFFFLFFFFLEGFDREYGEDKLTVGDDDVDLSESGCCFLDPAMDEFFGGYIHRGSDCFTFDSPMAIRKVLFGYRARAVGDIGAFFEQRLDDDFPHTFGPTGNHGMGAPQSCI